MLFIFLFKQKTAYDLRISDWSSDVCSSDLKVSATLSSNVPVFTELDPLDPDQVATPHRCLREARRNQPVFFMPKYGWYVVTRLDDLTRIANDPWTFSKRIFVTVPEIPELFLARLPNGFSIKVQLEIG